MRKKYLDGSIDKKSKKRVIVSVIPLFVKIMFVCVKEQRLYQKDEGHESRIVCLDKAIWGSADDLYGTEAPENCDLGRGSQRAISMLGNR